MALREPGRHQPGDLEVAPGREAFSALLDDFFDRADWWRARQAPWPRLSLQITTSRPNVARWLKGGMPKREHLYHLQNLIGVHIDVLEYALVHNAFPEGALVLEPTSRMILCSIVDRLEDPYAADLITVARHFLALQELEGTG